LSSGALLAGVLGAVALPAMAQTDLVNATDAAVTATTTTVSNSSGCGKSGTHTGLQTLHTTDGLGRTRTFVVDIPSTYSATHAYALAFVFHGYGGNSSQSYSWGLQSATGAAQSSIFVFPDGVQYLNYGIGWNDSKNGYDMPFFDNMVRAMESAHCVNTTRIFAAGFSWGGDFVAALICARPHTLRAAAVNSATDEYGNRSNFLTYINLPCPTSAAYPHTRFEHAVNGDGAYPAPNFATTSNLLKYLHHCGTTSTSAHSSTNVMSCVSHNSCTNQFIECSFNSSIGHALPPNWAADTWGFFNSFQ